MKTLLTHIKYLARMALLAAAGLGAGSASANLITNGSFEIPGIVATRTDGLVPASYRYERLAANAFTGWIHNAGAPVLDTVAGKWVAQDGTQYTEVESGFAGELAQVVPTVAGQQYLLTFYMAADPAAGTSNDDALRVVWDESIVDTVDLNDLTPEDLSWNLRSYLVTATSSSTVVRFQDAIVGAPFIGAYLDNVSLVAVKIPEPGTLQSFMLGALLLSIARRQVVRR